MIVMSQSLLCLQKVNVGLRALLLVFAPRLDRLLLVVYLVILSTMNLFRRFTLQPIPNEVLHETVKSWWRTEDFVCRHDYMCNVQFQMNG